MKRLPILLLLAAICTATLIPVRPLAAAPLADPPTGWVLAQVVSGGCDAAGHCSSTARPGNPTLYEYRPDRVPVGRNYDIAHDYATHGGFSTFVTREKCHIGTVDYYWSAGIWHHGGYWTLSYDSAGREYWSGPSQQHWAFEHNDVCQAVPTPIPTNTAVPPPPGAPTYTPAPAPTDYPTPTIPPSTCTSTGSYWEARANARISVPNVTTREYGWDTAMPPANQPIWMAFPLKNPLSATAIPPSNLGRTYIVQPDVPLTFAYDFTNMETGPADKLTYVSNHNGQAQLVFGLRDNTSARDLLLVSTTDAKELKDINGKVLLWGRTLKIASAQIDPGVTFLASTQMFSKFDRLHGGGWTEPSVQPRADRYMPKLGVSLVQFTPQNGHRYSVWTWNGHGPCRIEAARWTVAEFTATAKPNDLPTPTREPPTPLPTATPLPPAPPVPNALFKLSIHSTLDPNSVDTHQTNGVYTSAGNTIAWPAGEVLDFTPRIEMTLSPPAPAYPGYAFRAHVQDWAFVSSAGQLAATSADALGRRGCRGSGVAGTGRAGAVCVYPYIGGASLTDTSAPTDSQMAGQGHVFWSVGRPLAMRPDVYVYDLGQLTQVDLQVEVRVGVEVVNLATAQVVASRTDTVAGVFGVTLVVPRSVK